jgi:hypothetical protein
MMTTRHFRVLGDCRERAAVKNPATTTQDKLCWSQAVCSPPQD